MKVFVKLFGSRAEVESGCHAPSRQDP